MLPSHVVILSESLDEMHHKVLESSKITKARWKNKVANEH